MFLKGDISHVYRVALERLFRETSARLPSTCVKISNTLFLADAGSTEHHSNVNLLSSEEAPVTAALL